MHFLNVNTTKKEEKKRNLLPIVTETMKTLPNWTISAAQYVVIRARKIEDGPYHTYYVPELQVVLDVSTAQDDADRGVILKLDRRYDSVHDLVMRTSMWADVMFDRVDQMVVILSESGKVIETLDIKKEFGVELAEHELRELKRENHFAIH